jgi:hypothetical protein
VELWTYREAVMADPTADLQGFSVEASDGGIGHVDSDTTMAGPGYLVIDTGPWIFGRKVIIPAGAVTHVDLDEQRVYLDLTQDQIRESPEFDPTLGVEDEYLDQLGGYYGPYLSGIR